MKFRQIILGLSCAALLMTGCQQTANTEKLSVAESTTQTQSEFNSQVKTEAITVKEGAELMTKLYDVNDFNQIDISNAISTNITKGDSFKVEVIADERMFDYIKLKVEDAKLIATVESDKRPKELMNKSVILDIVCPDFNRIDASNAVAITLLSDFDVMDCGIDLSNSCTLKGIMHGENLILDVSNASSVQLGGDFTFADIDLSNASSADLSKAIFDNSDVDVSNASSIEIAVNQDINLDASTASSVTVISGNLAKVDIDKSVSLTKN